MAPIRRSVFSEQSPPSEDKSMAQPKVVEARSIPGIPREEEDFSLALGGPLYQLYLRTGLARPALDLLIRRVIGISLICWLPLLLLAAFDGHLLGGVAVPFLRDPEVHVRFLIAIPLLIAAEVLIHQRLRPIVMEFSKRGIIAPKDLPRFEAIIGSAIRLRNSVTLEVVLLIVVTTLGVWVWRENFTLKVSTWYATTAGGFHLTPAGYCYSLFSLTIFRFILFRWYFRLSIWYWLLWQIRKLPLQFNLFHPDRSGGIGFLAGSLVAFSPVFIAQTAVLSAVIFDRILYLGDSLLAYKMLVVGMLIFCVLVVMVPLGFFAIQLEEAGRTAKFQFGGLASHYVSDFHRKWIERALPAEEPLLGTSDIQSLADLANSYAVAAEIRVIPVTKQMLARFIVLIALPLLPLVLTLIPFDEILKGLFKLVF